MYVCTVCTYVYSQQIAITHTYSYISILHIRTYRVFVHMYIDDI